MGVPQQMGDPNWMMGPGNGGPDGPDGPVMVSCIC